MGVSALADEYQPVINPKRSAGVLLHPSSLPGPFGIGDLGPAAFAWIDALARARQRWWQILPLGPTGYADSPYQSFSAFAGNPNLISPQLLLQDGLIEPKDVEGIYFPDPYVDYGAVIGFKNHLLSLAWQNFQAGRGKSLLAAFDEFKATHAGWLDEYALFMALKDAHGGVSWLEWPDEARKRDQAFLRQTRTRLAGVVGLHQFRQFLFFRQWQAVRDYAHERAVRIIGDIPIFVAADSADVWANPQLFRLDRDRRPTVVAGVPPDYFSETGQLWGNPHYDWKALEATEFRWWIDRFRSLLGLVDFIRLDHFRGFEASWEVSADSLNAIKGCWVKAPGKKLLEAVRRGLGEMPIIAENLGVITAAVETLRTDFGLPGMRVLQFAFGAEPTNPFLPHNYEQNTVVYTGTHDNDTTWGWYQAASEHERDHVRRYIGRDGADVAWDLIREAWASVADYAITPLQDILSLGSEARMNFPGRPRGNWTWRLQTTLLTPALLDRLGELTTLYGRDAQLAKTPEASKEMARG